MYHDKGLRQLFVTVAVLTCLFPAVNMLLIYPKYRAQMLGSVQQQAGQLAQHLAHLTTTANGDLQIALNGSIEPSLLQDFGLLKIKLFDRHGRVVYSSLAKDIGQVNDRPSFTEEVAQGRAFSQVVTKAGKSDEGEVMPQDIVESYQPMINDGAFVGAFKLYYDITALKASYTRIYLTSLLSPLPLILAFLTLFGLLLRRLDTELSKRGRDQEQIESQRNTLLSERDKQLTLLASVERAKRQWEATMDRVDDMVLMTDHERRIIRCNQAVSTTYALPFAEIIGKPLDEFLPGLMGVSSSGEGIHFDYCQTGSGRWFAATLYQNQVGEEKQGLVLTLHDVTDIKGITTELERKNLEISISRAELQGAVDEISALIQRVGEGEDFAAYFKNDLPHSCHEFMRCEKPDCPSYDKKERCWQMVGTFCGGKVQGQCAQKFKSCSECPYFEAMTANPINMIGEQFNNMMHVLEDKNRALQNAYAELKQTQSHLLQQEKMASIGQLAAGVAHEINNPVGFISSNLNSLLKYGTRLGEYLALDTELLAETGMPELIDRQAEGRKRHKVDFILNDINDLVHESLDGCERVKVIVQNLKGFSRVDQATHQTVDIHECIDSTIIIVWNELKYKTTVVKDYQAKTALSCFPQQLNQVFMNLLVNASHAIEKKGLITIKTWEDGAFLFVAISDTGSGIAPEHLGRIFEPFFTTKEVGKGTGLGLSIVYDIVTKNHHGDITVDSTLGEGTTFTVKLPFEKQG